MLGICEALPMYAFSSEMKHSFEKTAHKIFCYFPFSGFIVKKETDD